MTTDFNLIVTQLLNDSKISGRSEDYKKAYIDGVLDFYNKMKREVKNDGEFLVGKEVV